MLQDPQTLTKDVHLWQHGKTYVFLLSGKAGTGKSLSAKILKELLSEKFSYVDIDSFAKRVKEIAFESFGWDLRKNNRGRELLQNIGNTGRQYYQDIWAEYVLNKYISPIPSDVLIIDDWRYPNEKYLFESEPTMKIVTIRINDAKREILANDPTYNDVSEVSLDHFTFDYTINDAEDATKLKEALEDIVESVLDF